MKERRPQPLVIIGAGGIGLEALWVVQDINRNLSEPIWEPIGFADDNPQRTGEICGGLQVLGTTAEVLKKVGEKARYHIGVGDNAQRARLATLLEKAGVGGATLVHPTVVVASTASIAEGCYVG